MVLPVSLSWLELSLSCFLALLFEGFSPP